MSDDHAAAEDKGGGGGLAAMLPTILVGVNLVAMVGAIGTLVYTRFIFKRPAITEETERKRLDKPAGKDQSSGITSIVTFNPITANIAQDAHGGNHYATVAFALEIRDRDHAGDIESVKPLLIDRFLTVIGKKSLGDLDNVQGRYVLRTELVEDFNKLIFENAGKFTPPPAPAAAEAKPAAGEGGEGGEGGEKKEAAAEHGEGKGAEGAPAAPKHEVDHTPIRDLVTSIYFSQFTAQ